MKTYYKQLKTILASSIKKQNLFIILFLDRFLFFDNYLYLNIFPNFDNFSNLFMGFLLLLSLILNLKIS